MSEGASPSISLSCTFSCFSRFTHLAATSRGHHGIVFVRGPRACFVISLPAFQFIIVKAKGLRGRQRLYGSTALTRNTNR